MLNLTILSNRNVSIVSLLNSSLIVHLSESASKFTLVPSYDSVTKFIKGCLKLTQILSNSLYVRPRMLSWVRWCLSWTRSSQAETWLQMHMTEKYMSRPPACESPPQRPCCWSLQDIKGEIWSGSKTFNWKKAEGIEVSIILVASLTHSCLIVYTSWPWHATCKANPINSTKAYLEELPTSLWFNN